MRGRYPPPSPAASRSINARSSSTPRAPRCFRRPRTSIIADSHRGGWFARLTDASVDDRLYDCVPPIIPWACRRGRPHALRGRFGVIAEKLSAGTLRDDVVRFEQGACGDPLRRAARPHGSGETGARRCVVLITGVSRGNCTQARRMRRLQSDRGRAPGAIQPSPEIIQHEVSIPVRLLRIGGERRIGPTPAPVKTKPPRRIYDRLHGAGAGRLNRRLVYPKLGVA
jgi:hypothetical protein